MTKGKGRGSTVTKETGKSSKNERGIQVQKPIEEAIREEIQQKKEQDETTKKGSVGRDKAECREPVKPKWIQRNADQQVQDLQGKTEMGIKEKAVEMTEPSGANKGKGIGEITGGIRVVQRDKKTHENQEAEGSKGECREWNDTEKLEHCWGEGGKRRGFNNPLKHQEVGNIVRGHKIGIAGLVETKLSSEKCRIMMIRWWKDYEWIKNATQQQKGQIMVMWRRGEYKVDALVIKEQFIHCRVEEIAEKKEFIMTVIYAKNVPGDRSELWLDLIQLTNTSKPWILGDFNSILQQDEKLGGLPFKAQEMEEFQQMMDGCQVQEIKTLGIQFTWSNKQLGDKRICCKLDRMMGSDEWMMVFSEAYVTASREGISDHCPLVLQWDQKSPNGRRPFKFFNMWLEGKDFQKIVKAVWEKEIEGTKQFQLLEIIQTELQQKPLDLSLQESEKAMVEEYGRLLTRDRLLQLGLMVENANCPLCEDSLETVEHLFIKCQFAKDLWLQIRSWIQFPENWLKVDGSRRLAYRWKGKSVRKKVVLTTIAAGFYHIWKARNQKIHENVSRSVDGAVVDIRKEIRWRVRSKIHNPKPSEERILKSLELW
ncbi:OLC1v1001867C1 [Oldenlandia corymbosa var. corymbosa]|uniref:OLC1v1001867C1 n=1 Tax=Oldenlandia corymbosa var. corymbosa TaxID=529605 RepID=A0AAV1D6Z8_OLDCO|nr:OLC1v1001867C1 [Oldenlandia corymbosa var. corymbosa]